MMHGKQVLWVPGVDHADIFTLDVMKKQFMKNRGVDKHALGREKFLEDVWKWKHEYGGKIVNQILIIRSSFDWQREKFTISNKRNKRY